MTSVGSISAQVTIDSSKVGPALATLKSQTISAMGEIEGKASTMGAAIGNALKTGLLAGTVAVGAALVGSTKAYADFEQGLASVSKTTGLTGKELENLGSQLRSLATAGPVTVAEFEKIASAAGSLGIGAQKMAAGDLAGARDEIVAFSKTMSDMAIAFEMDVDTVSTSMADIANVYGVPTEGLAKLGSQINSLENSMSATAPQIIEFMNAFGGTAAMFGESAEKTAAFGATLSQLGIKGSEASTQIRSGVLQLTQSSKEGQANLEKMAKLMGVSVDQLKKDIDQDLYGTLIRMGQAFKNIQGDTTKAAEAQKIFGAYGYSALIKLGDGADEYATALQLVQVHGDELTKEASTMSNTLSGQWQRLKNNVYDLGISIGSVTSGPLRDFLAFMNDGLIPATKNLFEALAKGDWDTVKKSFQAGIEAIQKQIEGIGSYITSLPWGQWFGQIAQYLTRAWDSAPAQVKPALDRLAQMLASGAGVDWGGAASKLVQLIATAIKDTIASLLEIGDWIHDKVVSWIDSGGPKKLGEDIMNAIAGGIKSLLGSASKFDFWGALKAAFSTVADWTKLGWEITKGIATGIISKTKTYLAPAQNQFIDFAETIADAFYALGTSIAEAIGTGVDAAGDKLASLVTWIGRNVPGAAAALSAVGVGSSTTTSSASTVKPVSTGLSTTGKKYAVYDNARGILYFEKYENAESYIYSNPTTASSAAGMVFTESIGQRYSNPLLSSALTEMYSPSWGLNLGALNTPLGDNSPESQKKSQEYSKKVSDEYWQGTGSSAQAIYQSAQAIYQGATAVNEEVKQVAKDAGEVFSATVDKGFSVTWTPISESLTTTIGDSKAATMEYLEGLKWSTAEEKAATTEIVGTTKLAFKEVSETTSDKWTGAANIICDMWAAQAQYFKDSVMTASSNIESAGTDMSTKLSQAAQNALTIGQQVAGNMKSAGEAVRIGLDASGKQIAVIGSVAQRQFESAGGKWISDASAGGTQAKTALQAGGSAAQSALQSGASAISSAASSIFRGGSSVWGTPFYTGALWHAEGTVTNGPELAVIGEEGKEFVIPTKRKRWDLLLAAMRAYGIRGFAEGGAAGAAGSEVSEAQEMTAYFGIKGLASMAKQVKKIISDLKDFFRITWGIIKSEGAVYWKQIENIILAETTTIRDNSWQAALDIRNQWISSNAAILADTTTQYAAMWPAIESSIEDVRDGVASGFEDMRSQVNYSLETMISDANTQFGIFKSDFNSVWSQILTDLQSTVSQISSILSSIGAQLSNINVNASVNLSAYGGGGYSSGGGMSGGNYIGGSSGGNDWSSTPTTFTDTTCLGDTVSVNALKYTSPSGVVTYINPLSDNFRAILAAAESGTLGSSGSYSANVSVGGGVSSWIDSGNWDFWAAQGALLDDGPKRVVAGEAGPELILPARLTRMFLSLADAGLGQGSASRIVIEDRTEHHWYMDGKEITNLVMQRAQKQLQLRGAISTR